MLKFIIGVIAGVWLAVANPEAAETIRTVTSDAYNWISEKGPAFIEHAKQFEQDVEETITE